MSLLPKVSSVVDTKVELDEEQELSLLLTKRSPFFDSEPVRSILLFLFPSDWVILNARICWVMSVLLLLVSAACVISFCSESSESLAKSSSISRKRSNAVKTQAPAC